MVLGKPFPIRVTSFVIASAILIGFGIVMADFLKTNFSYQGEAFMKGYGRILKEDLSKGLIFVILVNFIPTALLAFLFFLLLEKEVQRIAFKILRIGAIMLLLLVLAYIGMKYTEGITLGIEGNERLIEIALTWILRVAGFFLGYKLIKSIIVERAEIKNYIS